MYANLSSGSLSHASLEESDFKLLSISPPRVTTRRLLCRPWCCRLNCTYPLLTRKTTREGPRTQPRIIPVRGNPGASKRLLSGLHATRLRVDAVCIKNSRNARGPIRFIRVRMRVPMCHRIRERTREGTRAQRCPGFVDTVVFARTVCNTNGTV